MKDKNSAQFKVAKLTHDSLLTKHFLKAEVIVLTESISLFITEVKTRTEKGESLPGIGVLYIKGDAAEIEIPVEFYLKAYSSEHILFVSYV